MRQTLGRGILYFAIALAVGAGAVQAMREERLAQPLQVGTEAPALVAPKRGGGQFNLEELRGQVALVSFWASWCGPCRRELPMLRELEQAFQAKGVKLVAANLDAPDEREARVARFLGSQPGSSPLVVWPDQAAVAAWNAYRLPTLYIVGRDGRIVAGHTSLQSHEALQREIEAALATGAPGR